MSSSPVVTRTPEQQAFCDAISSRTPACLIACAGTGKTTTIAMALSELAPTERSNWTVIAFNKENQIDLGKKMPIGTKVSTLHALGYKATRSYLGTTCEVKSGKNYDILIRQSLKGKREERSQIFRDTLRLVSLAKNWGIGVEGKEGLLPNDWKTWQDLAEERELYKADIDAAMTVLEESYQQCLRERWVDFDDMLWIPLLHRLSLWETSNMIVDEAQDLSPRDLELLRRCPGKIWYVGDPRQCIYSFRGAGGGENFLSTTSLHLPLTVSWRCDNAIIAEAQRLVPEIKARGGAGEGLIERFREGVDYDWSDLVPSTVLARRNCDLIRIGLSLMRVGRPFTILGKEFGDDLTNLLKVLPGDGKELAGEIELWKTIMCEKYPHQAGNLRDISDCLLAMLEYGGKRAGVEKLIKEFFTVSNSNGWTLSTIHKAKGKEWDSVFIINWERPNVNDEERKEEENLLYVAITRAKHNLTYIEPIEKEEAWKNCNVT